MLFRQIIHEDLGCASYLIGDEDAGLAAAILFIAVFTLQFTMTMAMRPFEAADEAAAKKPLPVRKTR